MAIIVDTSRKDTHCVIWFGKPQHFDVAYLDAKKGPDGWTDLEFVRSGHVRWRARSTNQEAPGLLCAAMRSIKRGEDLDLQKLREAAKGD